MAENDDLGHILGGLKDAVGEMVSVREPDGTTKQLPLKVANLQAALWIRDELRRIAEALEALSEHGVEVARGSAIRRPGESVGDAAARIREERRGPDGH